MATGGDARADGTDPGARILAFDLARGLAVVFMILVHVMRHWGDPSTWTTPIGTVVSFLGGPPAAPVFMFLMGAVLAFSRRSSFGSLARRGLVLLAMGYALNLTRGTIPLSLGMATGFVTAEEVAPFTPLSLFTTVDILQLAGCSLILMAVLRRFAPPGPAWLVVAAAAVVVAPALYRQTVGLPIADALLGLLWSSGTNVYYPVLPWVVFPLAGAVVGDMVVRASDRRALIRRIGLIGVVSAVLGTVLVATVAPPLDDVTYWRLPPILLPGILGFVAAWVWLCDVVVHRMDSLVDLGVVYGWSRRVTSMYVIHWLIVAWGVAFVGFRVLDLGPVLVAMVAVLVATIVVARWRPRLPRLTTPVETSPARSG